MSFLDRFFGPTYEKELKSLRPLIAEINEHEPKVQDISDENIKKRIDELRKEVQSGTSLDDVLVETFALVREAGKRTLEQRHYDEQLIGGIILHRGCARHDP